MSTKPTPGTSTAPKRTRKRAAAPAVVVEEIPAVAPAAEVASVEAIDAKPAKSKKARMIRDSFTMPDTDYQLIADIKKRCLNAGVAAKKSEILRAALANLASQSDADLLSTINAIEAIKTGRPAKNAK